MIKSISTFLFLLLNSIVSAQYCNLGDRFTEVEYFSNSEISILKDVTYGSAFNYQGNKETLLFDVYYPNPLVDSLTKKPLVLMIHGGGFHSGNKTQRRGECIAFAKRGFIAVSISYRLGWSSINTNGQLLAMYRAQQDANAALRYLINNQSIYQVDPNWIFIGGTSAGAVTANNVAYSDHRAWESIYPGIEGALGSLDTSSNKLTNSFTIQAIFNNWGAVPKQSIKIDELLPQIAFHGLLDSIVTIDSATLLLGSRSIHYLLSQNTICTDFTVDNQGGHGIYFSTSGTVFRASRASCFFRSIICDNCTDFFSKDSIHASCSNILGIKEQHTLNYRIYPNPTHGQLNIEGAVGTERFTLINSIGEKIYDNVSIDELTLEYLSPGLYVLNIYMSQQNQALYFIKLGDNIMRY